MMIPVLGGRAVRVNHAPTVTRTRPVPVRHLSMVGHKATIQADRNDAALMLRWMRATIRERARDND